MNRLKRILSLCLCLVFIGNALAQSDNTFTNPLLPGGPDPWNIFKDGFYYYMHTGGDKIELWKTKNLADLKTAERKVIYRPPAGTMHSKNLWAPEIHYLKGKWYVYYAADGGSNKDHRMYVLENASQDPMQGEFVFKGKIADPSDKWAIDGTVFEYKRKMYFAWSGWDSDENREQWIYIAQMKNPWTIKGDRVLLAKPEYVWERNGVEPGAKDQSKAKVVVTEGPQALKNKDGKLFLVYSASGCWTGKYALGLLTFSGKGKILDASQWSKKSTPVFSTSVENNVFAPGHNSFFKSPDGKEDWILYHATDKADEGCSGKRSPRIQKFTWNADGTPNFGVPQKAGVPMARPSGN